MNINHILLKINSLFDEKKVKNREIFAKKVNINRQTMQNHLSGKSKITIETLLKIAEGLEVSPCYFLDCGDNKEYKVGNITVGENSYLKNTVGDSNVANESGINYEVRKKNDVPEKEFKEIQLGNITLNKQLGSAFSKIEQLEKQNKANLQLIEFLSK